MKSKGIAAKAIVYISLFISPHITQAKLNIRTGEYRWSYILNTKEMKIRLTYSSRGTYSGLFGAGWCSSLDYESTEVGLFHCGRRITKPPDDLKKRLRLKTQYSAEHHPLRKVSSYKFKYKDKLLKEIIDPNGQIWKFRYNALTNMTTVIKPSRKIISIYYDDNNDRVQKIENGRCIENMDYKQSARKRWITYEKYCSGKLSHAQYYEVTYALSSTGGTYIQQVKLRTPKRSTLIEYTENGNILNINLTNRKGNS